MRRASSPVGEARDAASGRAAVAARLAAAEAVYDELLARVGRRRQARDALIADIRLAMQRTGLRLEQLTTQGRALDVEIHRLMQALVEDEARSRAQRIALDEIYAELEQGVLGPRPVERPAPPEADPVGGGAGWSAGDHGGGGWGERGDGGSRPGGRAADEPVATRPKPTDRGALRGLFRRLAEALHPDKVQDEAEQARRTEIMKQITVAYGEGDYARLVELERTWLGDAGAARTEAPPVDDPARLAALEAAVAELEQQLADVDGELDAIRASPDAVVAREYRRYGTAGGPLPMELAAEAELVRLRDVRDFIVGFRDGRLTFEQFRSGPEAPARPAPRAAVATDAGDDGYYERDDDGPGDDGYY